MTNQFTEKRKEIYPGFRAIDYTVWEKSSKVYGHKIFMIFKHEKCNVKVTKLSNLKIAGSLKSC